MSTSKNVVNVHTTNKFTNEHLEISKQLINKTHSPDLYGNNTLYGEDGGRHLVDIKDIKWLGTIRNTQKYIASGGNSKYKEVKNSITDFGFKLKNEPVALRRMVDGLHPLTGHTRKDILEDLGFTNVVAQVYENMTDEQASKFGLILNRPDDPRGSVSIEDIRNECERAIAHKWIKPDLNSILERVNEICGDSVFTDNKRSLIATMVYNNWNNKKPGAKKVVAWTDDGVISTWMNNNNYVDTPNLMYMTTSFSQVSKAIFRAAKLFVENPGKQIRVVVHTGILDAFDLVKCYNERVDEFKLLWNSKIKDLQIAIFKTKPDNAQVVLSDNIVLYGHLPSLESEHPLDKMLKYKKTSKIISNGKEI